MVYRAEPAACKKNWQGIDLVRGAPRDPRVAAQADDRLLTGRLSSGSGKDSSDRAGPERHAVAIRLFIPGHGRRQIGGKMERQRPFLGKILAVYLCEIRFQLR